MDNIKDDDYYIRKIIKDIDFIIEHAGNVGLQEFQSNEVLVDSVMFRFIQIAENAQELTQPFLEENKNLPWNQLKGIRNRIVHAYDIVRVDIVYDTVANDLRPFRDALNNLLETTGVQ